MPWEAEAARDRLEQCVNERFGDPDGIGVLDETGIPQKGTRSVGVAQHYCAAVGKRANCQVATLLTYAGPRGHVFWDRRLSLPEAWCRDPERRVRAHIPETVHFQTKAQQARAPCGSTRAWELAWELGVPMRWVTGDRVSGESTPLGEAIEQAGTWYLLAVTSVTRVWPERPALLAPAEVSGGRPRRSVRLAPGAPKAQTVAAVVTQLPRQRWRRLSVGAGAKAKAKGARIYAWACRRVVDSRDDLPGPEGWLLARRSVSQPQQIASSVSCAPHTIPLQRLAQVASTRYTVEQGIEEAKGETGLDRCYEVGTWPSWYRHITLTMLLAHAWRADRRSQPEPQAGKNSSAGRPDAARSAPPARDRIALA